MRAEIKKNWTTAVRKGEGFILRYADDEEAYTGSLGTDEKRPTFSRDSCLEWAKWLSKAGAEVTPVKIGNDVFISDRMPPWVLDQE